MVAQLELDTVLGDVILRRRGQLNDIEGRAGGQGENDERHAPFGRGRRSSFLNVPITQLKNVLRLPVD